MANDASALLLDSGKKARHIHKSDQRNVKCIAKADKARRLIGGIDVQHAGQMIRLAGDNADRAAFEPSEANNNVCGKFRLDFKKFLIIQNALDHIAHIIYSLIIDRNNPTHLWIGIDRQVISKTGRILKVVGGHETKQTPAKLSRFLVVLSDQVNHARTHLRVRPAQLLIADDLASNLFDQDRKSTRLNS